MWAMWGIRQINKPPSDLKELSLAWEGVVHQEKTLPARERELPWSEAHRYIPKKRNIWSSSCKYGQCKSTSFVLVSTCSKGWPSGFLSSIRAVTWLRQSWASCTGACHNAAAAPWPRRPSWIATKDCPCHPLLNTQHPWALLIIGFLVKYAWGVRSWVRLPHNSIQLHLQVIYVPAIFQPSSLIWISTETPGVRDKWLVH